MSFMERWRRAWRILRGKDGRDELEQRALSYACAVLTHLEQETEWDKQTCRLIAHEGELRKLNAATIEGHFYRTTDGVWLCTVTPIYGGEGRTK